MSKIGKKSIVIPEGVNVSIDGDANKVTVKGPKGELEKSFDPNILIKVENGAVVLCPARNSRRFNVIWGLSRSLLANMICGVKTGYEKCLELQGIGFKAFLKGSDLELNLGFSHPVIFKAPKGIEFKVEKNVIRISGIDKQSVGQAAADIRALKKPEPYKGKGIRYVGEQVRRKVGKKVAGTTE